MLTLFYGLLPLLMLMLPAENAAGDTSQEAAGCLYGTVIARDGTSHTGFLLPDSGDAWWDDQFRATRADALWVEHVDTEALARARRAEFFREHGLLKRIGYVLSGRDKKDARRARLFLCRYGQIEGIVIDDDHATVTVVDGSAHRLYGGGDLRGDLVVMGRDTVELDWDDVRSVSFAAAPAGAAAPAARLRGTVTTSRGELTGFIRWDRSEADDDDILDGEDPLGEDHDVPMGTIASIARGDGDNSLVTLRDGTVLDLSGTNDVNHDNRGIEVEVAGLGRVTVPWEHFERVDFVADGGSGLPRAAYEPGGELHGRITDTSGRAAEGRIVWDLDEGWTWDLFNGEDDGFEYDIPFALIAVVSRSSDGSHLRLRHGGTLTLNGGQDASGANTGLLVIGETGTEQLNWDAFGEAEFR